MKLSLLAKIKATFLNLYRDFLSFVSYSWPINFSNLQKFRLVGTSVLKATINLKIFLGIFIAGLLSSTIFLVSGIYFAVTVDSATNGGEIREVFLNSSIESLNPVLETNSDAEKKINSLLYHPLYYVNYPNFLQTSSEPKIQPVLLQEEPRWQEDKTNPENNFKILKFKLKKEAKWCDGSQITVDDMIYSFNRIKEQGGNQDFRALFQDYELVALNNSNIEFAIQPISSNIAPNPQLIYNANFQPISRNFYQNLRNNELKISERSRQPANSSGFYCFPTQVANPDGSGTVSNPVKKDLEGISSVVLKRNANSLIKDPYIETYIFRFLKSLTDTPGNTDSLQRASKDKKVDLFTRFSVPQATGVKVSNLTDLKTKVVDTNTYFSLFLNIQASDFNLDGFLVNQTLRKYLVCGFQNLTVNRSITDSANLIPADKRFLPIQFSQSFSPDCTNVESELLNLKNSRGSLIYTIENDEQSKIKRVKVFGNKLTLSLLSLTEFTEFNTLVENRLLEMGLPLEVTRVDSSQVDSKLAEKKYHLTFLPTTILNRNPYNLFGSNGKNIINLTKNERVNGKDLEETLKKYSQSNLTDTDSRDKLINFFQKEFVMVNLLQGRQEINYSSRIQDLESNLPKNLIMVSDLYRSTPFWYTETTRKWRF